MDGELCRLCGGDGRIGNALGRSSATCPSCHGSGRRAETSSGFHDVTKTKPSHYNHPRTGVASPPGPKGPTTPEGMQLALEVSASVVLAEDPKARLLGCLSRLRPVVDDESRKRLLADRERVRLDLSAVDFDLTRGLALAARGLASASRAALELALEAFRGELLEGLELAEAFRFQAWCTAQREAARRLHGQLLRALLDRAAGEPEEELQILRRLLELDPADEGAHRQAMRLLVAPGGPRPAPPRAGLLPAGPG